MTPGLGPLVVGTNRPAARFYAGGPQIDAFRSLPGGQDHTPEDWVASMTPVRGQAPAGLTTLPDGILLLEAIRNSPVEWLGAEHVARWGADSMILVKLLDAGERLPVHAHPDDAFAATMLASAHGKAEAWFILEPGVVYLGLREDIDRAELAQLVRHQDTSKLLGLLNEVPVAKNDAVVVPPEHSTPSGAPAPNRSPATFRLVHPAGMGGIRYRRRGRGTPRPGLRAGP